MLTPVDGTVPADIRPRATVERDGSFELSTFGEFDGAPTGRYAVTIVWPSDSLKQDDDNVGPDRLRNKYKNPAKSAWKIEIKNGPNDLRTLNVE